MGFFTGIFLMYMTAEESFWALHALMRDDEFNIHLMYAAGMPLLFEFEHVLDLLIKKDMPKVFKHFAKQDIMPLYPLCSMLLRPVFLVQQTRTSFLIF